MSIKNKKGFTLIELIAVLVILAILALIVTPLVLNIIRKARTAADKRSIDAYGRSIEIAIAGYLLDNGTFPTSIGQLTIDYSGDEVVCSTTQLNGDSSVYLTGCTVGGRSVDYAYGKEETGPTYTAYSVGDQVTYNNVNYYVIADSGTSESTVTLLKAEPLSVEEVNTYGGVGTANNHVNMYVTEDTSASYYQQALNINYNNSDTGIGGMAYYTSSTCTNYGTTDGCTTSYADSEIKYVVDAWKSDKAPLAIEARLITLDDLTDNLGMEFTTLNETTMRVVETEETPSWIFGTNYGYWTSTTNADKTNQVWYVSTDGNISSYGVHGSREYHLRVVRPVIIIQKSALSN